MSVLLDNLPGAVYCCRNDANMTVDFASEHVEQITGCSPQDLIHGRVHWAQLLHRADAPRVAQEVDAAVTARQPWSLRYRIHHASGTERWVWDRGRAIFDGDTLVCLQGFVTDVTESHCADEQLRQSEERFRATFENAAVGIAHIGLDGRWLRVNNRLCEIVGYTYEELRDKTFGDITHPEDLDADWGQAMLLMAGKIPSYSMEKRYFRKDGSIVWINLTGSLVRNPEGGPEYFIAVVEDIDRRKCAERALELRTQEAEQRAVQLRELSWALTEAEDRERRRIAQVLHDHLQQLLVAAKMSLASIDGQADGTDFRGPLDRVQALLDESIQESRALTSELSPPVLYSEGLVKALRWLSDWMRDKHGLAVKIECGAIKEPPDRRTGVLLFQSVRELLFNIVKHAGVFEAAVTITATEEMLRVVVQDHGRGFDPAPLQSKSHGSSAGDGFGHFAIRERLAMIGGCCKIASTPGHGTCITLDAPIRSNAPASPGLEDPS